MPPDETCTGASVFFGFARGTADRLAAGLGRAVGDGAGDGDGVGEAVIVGSTVGAAAGLAEPPQALRTNAPAIMNRGSRRITGQGYVSPPVDFIKIGRGGRGAR